MALPVGGKGGKTLVVYDFSATRKDRGRGADAAQRGRAPDGLYVRWSGKREGKWTLLLVYGERGGEAVPVPWVWWALTRGERREYLLPPHRGG